MPILQRNLRRQRAGSALLGVGTHRVRVTTACTKMQPNNLTVFSGLEDGRPIQMRFKPSN